MYYIHQSLFGIVLGFMELNYCHLHSNLNFSLHSTFPVSKSFKCTVLIGNMDLAGRRLFDAGHKIVEVHRPKIRRELCVKVVYDRCICKLAQVSLTLTLGPLPKTYYIQYLSRTNPKQLIACQCRRRAEVDPVDVTFLGRAGYTSIFYM